MRDARHRGREIKAARSDRSLEKTTEQSEERSRGIFENRKEAFLLFCVWVFVHERKRRVLEASGGHGG